ncbi:MAG: hypothetical protein KGY67_00620 [Candidatus Thermoplasmatota archaeon]|nr:hypothetical protein [Candidatus Thermoplasmatota archaeon]
MKQHILVASIIIALVAIASVPPVESTTTWMNYREDISISAITVDIDEESLNVSGNNMSTNITLPCIIGNLNNSETKTTINASSNCTFNLTVNGVSVNSSTELNSTAGYWANITLAHVISAGVDENNTYINLVIEANASEVITAKASIYGQDISCYSSWVTSIQTVEEKDVVKPTVGTSSTSSFMTVNDSINISHTLGYNVTDFNATLSYPSHAVSTTSYYNFGIVQNNTGKEIYKQYQKYGPFVYNVESDVDGNEHEATIYVKSNELLTLTVDYSLITSDSVYEDYLDTLNYDTLDVKLNGVDVEWTEGSIEFEDLTIKEGWSVNEFTLSWTEAEVPVPTPPTLWQQELFGLQVYIWALLAMIVAIIIILIWLSKD